MSTYKYSGYQKDSACTARGEREEVIFLRVMTEQGWQCQAANLHENKYEKWDVKCSKEGHVCFIDVKAAKKYSRSDDYVQTETTFIEIAGEFTKGWLWSPITTHIAFGQEHCYTIVPLKAIQTWFNNTYANGIVEYTTDKGKGYSGAPYGYRRPGKRNECIVSISYKTLTGLPGAWVVDKPINISPVKVPILMLPACDED